VALRGGAIVDGIGAALRVAGVECMALRQVAPSLEDVFVEMARG
jgi:hypothetical protein